ncbi:hypothetical protein J6590_085587 [Homalodisca vitripennis]|nr:hypothetical protein J6590_085587 [Homalodisca vitripennis]
MPRIAVHQFTSGTITFHLITDDAQNYCSSSVYVRYTLSTLILTSEQCNTGTITYHLITDDAQNYCSSSVYVRYTLSTLILTSEQCNTGTITYHLITDDAQNYCSSSVYVSMQTLVTVLWTATILLEVKTQEDELWDPWADNCESMVPCTFTSQLLITSRLVESVALVAGSLPGEVLEPRHGTSPVMSTLRRPVSTAMHADNSPKTEVTVRWAPEDDNDATVTF